MLMRRFLPALVTVITLAAGLVTAVETATPALAASPMCLVEATGICLYADGLNGHYVYGRVAPLHQSENAFETSTAKAYVCSGSFTVTSTCPFIDNGSIPNYTGDTIFRMQNAPSGWYFLGRYAGGPPDGSDVVQGNSGTGDEWVAVPQSGAYTYLFINVSVTNQNAQPTYLCAQTTDAPVQLVTQLPGSGACLWEHVGGF